MIRSDSHFMIGHSHTVCEDYCANLGSFAALADGCSAVLDDNGNRIESHTDIGARLLVRAAFHHASTPGDMLGVLAINTADGYRRQLDLPIHTLSATLGCIRAIDTGFFEGRLFGDGVVAARMRGGKWAWDVVNFGKQPPRYLRYDLRDHDAYVYSREHGNAFQVEASNWPGTQASDYPDSISKYPYYVDCDLRDYDMVLIMSDGATSFTKDSRPVGFPQLADRLLDFRRMKGRFVLRQLTGVLKELAADGIVNQDDISMIALHEDEPCPNTTLKAAVPL